MEQSGSQGIEMVGHKGTWLFLIKCKEAEIGVSMRNYTHPLLDSHPQAKYMCIVQFKIQN